MGGKYNRLHAEAIEPGNVWQAQVQPLLAPLLAWIADDFLGQYWGGVLRQEPIHTPPADVHGIAPMHAADGHAADVHADVPGADTHTATGAAAVACTRSSADASTCSGAPSAGSCSGVGPGPGHPAAAAAPLVVCRPLSPYSSAGAVGVLRLECGSAGALLPAHYAAGQDTLIVQVGPDCYRIRTTSCATCMHACDESPM